MEFMAPMQVREELERGRDAGHRIVEVPSDRC
jgi:hypothetical protein